MLLLLIVLTLYPIHSDRERSRYSINCLAFWLIPNNALVAGRDSPSVHLLFDHRPCGLSVWMWRRRKKTRTQLDPFVHLAIREPLRSQRYHCRCHLNCYHRGISCSHILLGKLGERDVFCGDIVHGHFPLSTSTRIGLLRLSSMCVFSLRLRLFPLTAWFIRSPPSLVALFLPRTLNLPVFRDEDQVMNVDVQ